MLFTIFIVFINNIVSTHGSCVSVNTHYQNKVIVLHMHEYMYTEHKQKFMHICTLAYISLCV